MHFLGICALIVGLPAFVIIGFLRVVVDLLSNDIFASPVLSNEARRQLSSTPDC
jgi:hypothetical protein